jgi:hypothetical protein
LQNGTYIELNNENTICDKNSYAVSQGKFASHSKNNSSRQPEVDSKSQAGRQLETFSASKGGTGKKKRNLVISEAEQDFLSFEQQVTEETNRDATRRQPLHNHLLQYNVNA